MAGFTPTILPALDQLRSIGDLLGLRKFAVYVKVTAWSGERPGLGTKTVTTTQMVNTDANGNTHPVLVKQMSRKDVIASGGQFTDQILKVGRMTPTYGMSGYTSPQFDPATNAGTIEINWFVTGPGLPPGGDYFDKVAEEATEFHFEVTLKRSARRP